MFILKNIKWIIPTVLLIVYIVLNQFGCTGKTIDKIVVERDTIYQIVFDTTFIPSEPIEVKVPVYIKVINDLEYAEVVDSLQEKFYKETDYFQKAIVERDNIIYALRANQNNPDSILVPSLTMNEYRDTIIDKAKGLEVFITQGVYGYIDYTHLKLKYLYLDTKEKPRTERKVFGYIGAGVAFDFNENVMPEIQLGIKNFYGRAAYNVSSPEPNWERNLQLSVGYYRNLSRK